MFQANNSKIFTERYYNYLFLFTVNINNTVN